MKLTDFLLARVAEDFDASYGFTTEEHIGGRWVHYGERMRRECEAKRQIMEEHPLTTDVAPVWTGPTPGVACANCAALGRGSRDIVEDIGPCDTLLALAAVYSDHPDYQQEWKP